MMTTQSELPRELTIWNNMSPMQRYEVMKQVPECKSITKRFRLCISFIKSNIEKFA